MSVTLRLSAITSIANAIATLKEEINNNEGFNLTLKRVVDDLTDSMLDIVQSVYDIQETNEERDGIIRFANKKLRSSTLNNHKFSLLDDKVFLEDLEASKNFQK